ncbi:MAG: hypothetical protein HPY85_03690 [Anaerolineae bacterium]|nr:hypothetical protein [Anaerolineae bacterium]
MEKQSNSLSQDFWRNLKLDEQDIEFLYNFLLEKEVPQKISVLRDAIIERKISAERKRLEKMQSRAALYMPKESYSVGEALHFSAYEMKTGTVIGIRPGKNPDFPSFQVIKVEFEDGEIREFASQVAEHDLNQPILFDAEDPNLNPEHVVGKYGNLIDTMLTTQMSESGIFSTIAELWFPESLLIDINMGHLNLAEAVLDFADKKPVSTHDIIEQVGFQDKNRALLEFSFNVAMQHDRRFDEVGPAGEVMWFLKSMEPAEVNEQPEILISQLPTNGQDASMDDQIMLFEGMIADEYDDFIGDAEQNKELTFSLIYPHWRAGTLPLSNQLKNFFPTSIETPHIRFTFIDGQTKKTFPGWVVRPFRYVCGLKEWYAKMELIPGSVIHIRKGQNPGEVIIRTQRKNPSREWLRIAKITPDGKLNFAMDMQSVKSGYNERMVIAVDNPEELAGVWMKHVTERNFENTVHHLMRELMKLNPQGHVHAQELYAATNLVLRCPPRAILKLLNRADWVEHQGDLYYRLSDTGKEGSNA